MNALTLYGIIGLGALVALNVLRYGVPALLSWRKASKAAKPASSDAAPPAGAVAWVQQITAAAGSTADASFVLDHLLSGATAAQIMADRIKLLEPKAATP